MAQSQKKLTQADQIKLLVESTPTSKNLEKHVVKQIVDIVTRIDATKQTWDDTIAVCSCLTKALASQRLLLLEATQVKELTFWLKTTAESTKNELQPRTDILRCLCALLQAKPGVANSFWAELFNPQHSRLLELGGLLPSSDAECRGGSTSIETYFALLMCMDAVLSGICVAGDVTAPTDEEREICHLVADTLLHKHFEISWTDVYGVQEKHIAVLLVHTLRLLKMIITLCPAYAQTHASELFGLAKEFLQFGINNRMSLTVPQKLHISQQMLYDSGTDVEPEPTRNAGGKVAKVRKPRAMVKHRHQRQPHNHQQKHGNEKLNQATAEVQSSEVSVLSLGNDMRIISSESELSSSSDNEALHVQGTLQERQRYSKVRLAAISLLGTVAHLLSKRMFYGYWHALFPINNNSGTKFLDAPLEQRCDIIHIGYSDPSVQCRSAALQVAAQMIYGSKQFLSKAASEKRRSATSFMPFAVSLALSVRCMYRTLSFILASEAATPVLTQTLKCLAVLIQATPFEQLEMGFVCEFMPYVKALTTSRDCTLQVAALMVMEFLVSRPVLTEEITCLVGLPTTATRTIASENCANNNENDEIIKIDAEDMELLESEIEENVLDTKSLKDVVSQKDQINLTKFRSSRTSWLLLRVLDNLDYDVQQLRGSLPPPTPVRIESLQVLVAISKHFSLFEDQLPRVCKALQLSLTDPLPDVRLNAGRCLDALAYQLSRYVLDTLTASDTDLILYYVNFWTRMLHIIYEVYDSDLAALKVSLCDAISNMGETIYERLPRDAQTGIIAFLSGCSSDDAEDMLVRAAATRALAVFVLFPTLKSDLVFVENIAELTLRLTSNESLNVRIKALWSLGNISDALITHANQRFESSAEPMERISDELLHRLTQSATEACTDNDKVRANAVRSLGNLLRLFGERQLRTSSTRELMLRGFAKLVDCIRSTGNAKVTWNACYAVCRLMNNRLLIEASERLLATLYGVVCQVIVRHGNFKVRINATAIILHIEQRNDFGQHFEAFWSALLAAIEQSHNLDNYYEYNHRDGLHEQLCLAMAHMLALAKPEDYTPLYKKLSVNEEIVRSTWLRVTNRMVPEKSAPLIACNALLLTKLRTVESSSPGQGPLTKDQRFAVMRLASTFVSAT